MLTLAAVSFAALGCASSETTQLVVLMDTDYAVPNEVDRLRARVAKRVDTGDGLEEVETWTRTFRVDATERGQDVFTLPATFAVRPAEDDIDGEVIVELEALAAATDTVLVGRRVRTGFVRGQSVVLRLLLYRACESLVCASGESCGCVDGGACAQPSCVDERVSPTVLEPIDDPGALPADSRFPTGAGGGGGGGEPVECTAPLEVCADECVNTRIDPRYCGDCDIACPVGFVCQDGGCVDPGDCSTNGVGCPGFTYCDEDTGRCLRGCSLDEQCPRDAEECDLDTRECVCSEGFERCNFECVDTSGDPRFCGSCDNFCSPGFVCESGRCRDPGDCRTRELDCPGFTFCDLDTGRCLFGCGRDEQCTGTAQVCDLSLNECVCDSGFHECGTGCVSDFDVQNCGDSCVPCSAPTGSTPTCDGSVCDFVCDANLQRCGAECVDVQSDIRYCGNCQTACNPGEECRAGECFDPGDCRSNGFGCTDSTYCDLGTGNCLPGCDRDGQCVDLNEACDLESNQCACKTGFHDCGGVCVSDLSVASCGTRCTPCPEPANGVAACNAGVCDFVCADGYERCGDACCLVSVTFQVRTVDASGNVGKYASIALDSAGRPHIAYYGESAKNALFAFQATNGDWIRETAASDEVGRYISLARRPNGTWVTAFYEEDDENLFVAVRTGVFGWFVRAADSSEGVGEHTSIAFDGNVGHIAYYDREDQDLRLAVEQPGGGWTRQTIDASGSVGEYASLAFDAAGLAHIAYYDETNKDLKLATELANGGWAIEVIAAGGDVGRYASLAFDPSGVPHISYWDEDAKDLVVATRSSEMSWTIETVDSDGDVGRYTSLAFGPDGTAHVSYESQGDGDLKYATKTPVGNWSVQTIDAAGDVGEYTSIAVDSDGNAHVAYYDETNTNLKYAIITRVAFGD